jgi:membrane protein
MLFTVGKSLIGTYLVAPRRATGALIVLMFRYYSAQIFLFGTELAKAVADQLAPADTQGREERFTKA